MIHSTQTCFRYLDKGKTTLHSKGCDELVTVSGTMSVTVVPSTIQIVTVMPSVAFTSSSGTETLSVIEPRRFPS